VVADEAGVDLIEHGAGAIQRILPHVQVSEWTQGAWKETESVWEHSSRVGIRVTLGIGPEGHRDSRSLTATVARQHTPGFAGAAGRVLDEQEYEFCKLIAKRISEVAHHAASGVSPASLRAIRDAFDEHVVAQYIEEHHGLQIQVSSVLESLRTLSEQSYENKALTFGCLFKPNVVSGTGGVQFPQPFLGSKKYKALSDGFRTAYQISSDGKVLDFVDLERFGASKGTHYFPDWATALARATRGRTCGIALSRQGDILVFDRGTLRLTYRRGRWQYWNHSHLVKLLSDTARAQHVLPSIRGSVVGAIYRAALDVSFRRSGGLFVILRSRDRLRDLVRVGDAIGDKRRRPIDREFDEVLQYRTILDLSRNLIVELASIDGAIVLANSGEVLAYGAVLEPKKVGRIRGTEGSRTKAAIGASNYGLALKISSDGDIAIYHRGDEFIEI
jgi:hypothetical protein